MHAFVIDAFEFCQLKESRTGEIAVVQLPRLAKETVDQSGLVQWALQGGADMLGNPMLTLAVSGSVQLICQRCLAPFDFEIDSQATLVLARDESQIEEIEEIEARLANDAVEVVVGSNAWNMGTLIEDEALLALPSSPKHETCPKPTLADALNNTKPASPFAILKNIKQ